ncbi:hypothetical protein [Pedobacter nutrimenti]|uniref:hypothetical protein n=1 Tax=Pedobacter nutrimenti TaxID=1241337 RepID=UPI00292F4CA4|nr:hypothetical protein [Pedobacter nutrimenti]
MGKKTKKSTSTSELDKPLKSKVIKRSEVAQKLKNENDKLAYQKALEPLMDFYLEEKQIEELPDNFIEPKTELASNFPHGWVLNVGSRNPTQYPVKSFTAEWIVPHPPEPNGQLFFVFIGLSNSTDLIQCMMQWGRTPCGGGQVWTIGCTHVVNGNPHCTSPNLVVNPGDNIQASITLLRQEGQALTYRLQINELRMDCLQAIIAPRDCSVVLESYTIESSAEYPPDNYTLIDKIRIDTIAGPMPIHWADHSKYNPDGQHTANPNIDRIALWYHGLPNNPSNLA